MVRIGVVAASSFWPDAEAAIARVQALADAEFGGEAELWFHPNCTLRAGHFAGTDEQRANAFLDVANDPAFDALWFARGGYGAARIADLVLPKLNDAAQAKTYFGYSDAGALLGALHANGIGTVAHGPMPGDITRHGEATVRRSLAWLARRDSASLEPNLPQGQPAAAFNLKVLSSIVGTPFEPDLTGHVLMVEEVSEHLYGFDRDLFHVLASPKMRGIAELRLGRFNDIKVNEGQDFGQAPEEIAAYACERAGVRFGGSADIGHDAENKVVPFG